MYDGRVKLDPPAQVGVVVGSRSDFETVEAGLELLSELAVSYELRVLSAHRTPDLLSSYAGSARARGLKAILAAAGGAAHLPGMLAAHTTLPVLGIPVRSQALSGLDSLLSIVQMPAGVPVATFAIGSSGAANAALFAAAILATADPQLAERLQRWRAQQTASVLANPHFAGHPAAPEGRP